MLALAVRKGFGDADTFHVDLLGRGVIWIGDQLRLEARQEQGR